MSDAVDSADVVHTTDKTPPRTRRKNLPRGNGHDYAADHAADTTPVPAPQQHPVLLVDSDTSAITAAQYLPPGWTVQVHDGAVNTSLGTATHAVVWGRNDEGGRTWAAAVADALPIPHHVVTLARLPPHWHLGEPLPADRTAEQLTGYLAAALGRCAVRVVPPVAPIIIPAAAAPPAPPQPPMPSGYICTPAGAIEKLYANVVYLLRLHPEMWPLSYDEFSNRAFLRGEPMQDADLRALAEWVQHNEVRCGTSVIHEGILRTAEMNTFHPVKEYLESLTWDGKPRLARMLTVLAGATPDVDGLSDLLGRKWMIQAVARIYEPGCQADAMLVLEGEQGVGKSSLFRALFGDRWFTDHLPDLKDKDAMLQLRGVWCVEISELAALGRSDSAKIKQFLTSRVDRYRDPYGRLVSDWPRTSVFAGTINPGAEGYLKDPTGGRRFWPVPITGEINISGVSENRDQLWAEAVAAYRGGEQWHFTAEELARRESVAARQSARLEEDPWEPAIEEYLATRDTATTGDILRFALSLTATADWGRGEQMRVGRILTGMKWGRRKSRDGDKSSWYYYRTSNAAPRREPTLPGVQDEDGYDAADV